MDIIFDGSYLGQAGIEFYDKKGDGIWGRPPRRFYRKKEVNKKFFIQQKILIFAALRKFLGNPIPFKDHEKIQFLIRHKNWLQDNGKVV